MKRDSTRAPRPIQSRGSGVLLHISSLPGSYGIGDLGPGAYRFADFLVRSRQRYWQILPLTAADYEYGFSPYNCLSAFAGNKYLISLELLAKDGLLKKTEIRRGRNLRQRSVNFPAVVGFKDCLFERVFERASRIRRRSDYEKFCHDNAWWLNDFSFFVALKARFGNSAWTDWPVRIKDRFPHVLRSFRKLLEPTIERERLLQFIFFQQWKKLKEYCNSRSIAIIGDVPIYVDLNSADVWAHRDMFKLRRDGKPTYISGVPPDYFSRDGQLWGNPVYHWTRMTATGFKWWVKRIEHNLSIYDHLRMDHFRGFAAYWEVRAGAGTARHGRWVKVPGGRFLKVLQRRFSDLPLIAEDLGTITPDVHALMRRFNLPGMRVLLFAFGEADPANPYLPHNHVRDCVVYTGTHDNNTVRGWFEDDASPREKRFLFRYLGKDVCAANVHGVFVRMAMESVANTVIIPMQDILGLDGRARMNRPASVGGNWRWRLGSRQLTGSVAAELAAMVEIYGRG